MEVWDLKDWVINLSDILFETVWLCLLSTIHHSQYPTDIYHYSKLLQLSIIKHAHRLTGSQLAGFSCLWLAAASEKLDQLFRRFLIDILGRGSKIACS